MYNCKLCNYNTDRIDAYKRHFNSKKHFKKSLEEEELNKKEEKNIKYDKCDKCDKSYKTKRYLLLHKKKCNGIDCMTCPRCMRTFNDSGNKSRHCKLNNCESVSIFEYLEKNNKINNDESNLTLSTLKNLNNNPLNIYINDYGKERLDYVRFDDFINIVRFCNNSIIPNYIRLKHFNPKFPENHNIKCKNNIFFIKRNNEWSIISYDILSKKLYDDGGCDIFKYLKDYDKEIKDSVKESRYEDIQMKANYVDLELQGHGKNIRIEIIDVLKNFPTPL